MVKSVYGIFVLVETQSVLCYQGNADTNSLIRAERGNMMMRDTLPIQFPHCNYKKEKKKLRYPCAF